MKTNVGDYVIVLDERNKKLLVQVTETEEARMTGVMDGRDRAEESTRVEVRFERRDVLANLGKTPHAFGSVYGITIEPFLKMKQVRPWTGVYVFRDLLETEETAILASLKKIGNILHQRGWFPVKPVSVEIRPAKGKWAGMYRHVKKPDAEDTVILRPKVVEDTDYIVAHEAGHGVWYNLLTDEWKAQWLDQFIKSTLLREVTRDDLKENLRELKDGGSCQGLVGRAAEDEDQSMLVKEIFQHIGRRHKLSRQDIDLLLVNEQFDQLDAIWPLKPMQLGKKDVLITEYATTKVEELFAEAFAYYALDRDMPVNIKKLMRRSLKSVMAE